MFFNLTIMNSATINVIIWVMYVCLQYAGLDYFDDESITMK